MANKAMAFLKLPPEEAKRLRMCPVATSSLVERRILEPRNVKSLMTPMRLQRFQAEDGKGIV